MFAPGWLDHFIYDEHYGNEEEFVFALADAVREEYRAVVDAGLYDLKIWNDQPSKFDPAALPRIAIANIALGFNVDEAPPFRIATCRSIMRCRVSGPKSVNVCDPTETWGALISEIPRGSLLASCCFACLLPRLIRHQSERGDLRRGLEVRRLQLGRILELRLRQAPEDHIGGDGRLIEWIGIESDRMHL